MQEASCWPRKGRAMRPVAPGQLHTTLTQESRDGHVMVSYAGGLLLASKGRAMRPVAPGQLHSTLTHESRDGQLCRRPPAGLEGLGPKKPGIHRANYTDHLHAKNSYAPGMCSGIHLEIWV